MVTLGFESRDVAFSFRGGVGGREKCPEEDAIHRSGFGSHSWQSLGGPSTWLLGSGSGAFPTSPSLTTRFHVCSSFHILTLLMIPELFSYRGDFGEVGAPAITRDPPTGPRRHFLLACWGEEISCGRHGPQRVSAIKELPPCQPMLAPWQWRLFQAALLSGEAVLEDVPSSKGQRLWV